jgi:hypothetical protein
MPSRSDRGKSSLALSVAVAAGLPVGIGAALFLAVSAASPACRDHVRRVVIDGAPVEAYATICREAGSWVLAGPPEEDAPVWEARAVVEEPEPVAAKAAVEPPPPPVEVAASNPPARPGRRSATHARRSPPASRTLHHVSRARAAEWGTVVSQPKYGP